MISGFLGMKLFARLDILYDDSFPISLVVLWLLFIDHLCFANFCHQASIFYPFLSYHCFTCYISHLLAPILQLPWVRIPFRVIFSFSVIFCCFGFACISLLLPFEVHFTFSYSVTNYEKDSKCLLVLFSHLLNLLEKKFQVYCLSLHTHKSMERYQFGRIFSSF